DGHHDLGDVHAGGPGPGRRTLRQVPPRGPVVAEQPELAGGAVELPREASGRQTGLVGGDLYDLLRTGSERLRESVQDVAASLGRPGGEGRGERDGGRYGFGDHCRPSVRADTIRVNRAWRSAPAKPR